MVLLESLTLPLGTTMPAINCDAPDGTCYTDADLMGEKGLAVIFTCNHCPYAIAIWERLIALNATANSVGVNMVAINPNINPAYPDDSPENMLKKIDEWGIPFPYLVDADQNIAKAFKAQCTPDLYLFDANKKLVYHGRLDDNWKDPSAVTKEELKEAILALGQDQPINDEQFHSMGCSIKWVD